MAYYGDGTAFTTSSRDLRIFVISLKRRTDRLAHMQAVLAERGLKADFVEAVDGQRLTPAQWSRYDAAKALAVYGAEMSAAELGCYLSHMSIYETMVAQGLDTALVLEDDIECDADFAEVLDGILAAPQHAWEVLRLQSTKGEVIRGDRADTVGDRSWSVRGRTAARLRTGVLGGCGYLIRHSGAVKMLAYGARAFMPIDQTMDRYWENGIEPYVLRPFPVRQSACIGSEIAERKTKAALGPYRTVVRRARRAVDGLSKRRFQLMELEGWRDLGAVRAVRGAASLRPGSVTPTPAYETVSIG